MGDLHSTSVAENEEVKEHAQWWHRGMKDKIDAQSRKDLIAPFVIDRQGSVLSAGVAEERNRELGQELVGVEERVHSDLMRRAEERELDTWKQFRGFSPVPMGAQAKDVVDTQWVLT